jgi:hypothetical protein
MSWKSSHDVSGLDTPPGLFEDPDWVGAPSTVINVDASDPNSSTAFFSFSGIAGDDPLDSTALSVLSLTQLDGTATLQTNGDHGYIVGNRIAVDGSDQGEYNGAHVITAVPSSSTIEFSVDSGAVSPATGTITVIRVSLEYRIDFGTWQVGDNVTYNDLTDGPHVFQARAVDISGNVDPTPAQVNWTIQEIPTIAFDNVPVESSYTEPDLSISFTATDNSSIDRIEVSFDSGQTWLAYPEGSLTNDFCITGDVSMIARSVDTSGNYSNNTSARSWFSGYYYLEEFIGAAFTPITSVVPTVDTDSSPYVAPTYTGSSIGDLILNGGGYLAANSAPTIPEDRSVKKVVESRLFSDQTTLRYNYQLPDATTEGGKIKLVIMDDADDLAIAITLDADYGHATDTLVTIEENDGAGGTNILSSAAVSNLRLVDREVVVIPNESTVSVSFPDIALNYDLAHTLGNVRIDNLEIMIHISSALQNPLIKDVSWRK